jgi:hypothetical protein
MTARTTRIGVTSPLPYPVIHLGSPHSAGYSLYQGGTPGSASGTSVFAAANEMLAFPFTLTTLPHTHINKVWWHNGTSVSANLSVGIYDADFNLMIETASTAQSGTSTPQMVSMPCKLSPGLYYCALACSSNTTNRLYRWSVAGGASIFKSLGCWKQASITVGALPNPATPVVCTTVGFPTFGLLTRTAFDL